MVSVEELDRLFDNFELEFIDLAGEVQASPETQLRDSNQPTIGHQFFPGHTDKQLVELNRTLVGVLALRWLYYDDHEAFTECQSGRHKLTRPTFNKLRDYTRSVIGDVTTETGRARYQAMETLVVINDLGKIQKIVDEVQRRSGTTDVDHDHVLLMVLERYPELSQSFQRLPQHLQELIVRGLRTDFNVAQFLQTESVAGNLRGLEGVDQDTIDFWMLHALADIAGAAGANVQNGSATIDELTAQNFLLAADCVRDIGPNNTIDDVYNAYLRGRARRYRLNIDDPEDGPVQWAHARLCCMLRVPDFTESEGWARERIQVAHVGRALSRRLNDHESLIHRKILIKELKETGTGDSHAILLYYTPALLQKIVQACVRAGAQPQDAIETALTILAKEYQQVRIARRSKAPESGVTTIMTSSIADAAATDLHLATSYDLRAEEVSEGGKLWLAPPVLIRRTKLPGAGPFADLPGKRIAVIGTGEGFDGNQAAMIAKLLWLSGKQCPSVISVRSHLTGSQGLSGKIGDTRTIHNHGGQICDGTYVITPETTGSRHFLEHIPAAEVPMRLVIAAEGVNGLAAQLEEVLEYDGGVDAVITVDTGGDSLYLTTFAGDDQSLATPSQDHQTLLAVHHLRNVKDKLSFIIAPGLDAPHDAEKVLQEAHARYRELAPYQARLVLEQYRQWKMDGSDPERIGKTCLGWQTALQFPGKTGRYTLPLPDHLIHSRTNPWSPFINITDVTGGIVEMTNTDHLAAIGALPPLPTRRKAFNPLRTAARAATFRNDVGHGSRRFRS